MIELKLRELLEKDKNNNAGKLIYWFITLIIAVLYAILAYEMPYRLEDWDFMRLYRDLNGNLDFSFAGMTRFISTLREIENGRIANMLSPFITMYSPWKELYPAATGIMMAVIIVISQKMATWRYRINQILMLALTWFLLLLSVSWRDGIFIRTYALNYIWSAGLNLIFLWFLIKNEINGWTVAKLILLSLLGIIASGMHEGFAVPVVAGLALLVFIKKFSVSYQFYVILCFYIIGTLFFFLSPATLNRVGSTVGFLPFGAFCHILFINFKTILLFIIILGILTFSSFGKIVLKTWFSNPFSIIGIGIIVTGCVIGIFTTATERTFMWANVFVCIEIVTIINIILIEKKHEKNWIKISGVCILILCTVQAIVTIVWTNRYRREFNDIYAQLTSDEGPTVFYDLIQPKELPSFTLKIPPYNAFKWMDSFLWEYINKDFAGVVPKDMRYVDIRKGEKIQGDAELVRINDYIISSYREKWNKLKKVRPDIQYFKVFHKDGKETLHPVGKMPFITSPFLHSNGVVKSDTLCFYYFDHEPDTDDWKEVNLMAQ